MGTCSAQSFTRIVAGPTSSTTQSRRTLEIWSGPVCAIDEKTMTNINVASMIFNDISNDLARGYHHSSNSLAAFERHMDRMFLFRQQQKKGIWSRSVDPAVHQYDLSQGEEQHPSRMGKLQLIKMVARNTSTTSISNFQLFKKSEPKPC